MESRWLTRLIGVVIFTAAVLGAFLLWLAVGRNAQIDLSTPPKDGEFLGIPVFYAPIVPTMSIFLSAVAIALLSAATVGYLEARALRRARRSIDKRVQPLSASVLMAETRGRFDGPVTVTVLVPAHNEADALPITLPALLSQSRTPDRVIVVADNCTDSTAAIAVKYGVEVFETVGNTEKKAGALNQVLDALLPELKHNDTVMVMDADTTLGDGFIEAAVDQFTRDRALSAVGGLFYGESGGGLLEQFQRNEYTRYSRTVNRRRGKVFVLTGTASVFRSTALKAIADNRGTYLPGTQGRVYDTYALTEDNELTIALKFLGATMRSPEKCTVATELMPTWKNLWNQRMRWQRGAVENIGTYGISPATARYWGQQLAIGYGVIALYSFFTMLTIMLLAVNQWVWFPFWLWIGVIFVVERVFTVWHGGWKARFVAALLLPELLYDCFLNAVFVKGVFDITFNRPTKWGHVYRSDAPRVQAAE